jgi:hypothetical protein
MAYRDEWKAKVESKFSTLESRCDELDSEIIQLEGDLKIATRNDPRPVATSIANKIRSFDMDTMFALLLWAALAGAAVGVGASLYMWGTADSIPDYCEYNHGIRYENQAATPKGWIVEAQVDWGSNETYGPFETMEEAKVVGKVNKCPN